MRWRAAMAALVFIIIFVGSIRHNQLLFGSIISPAKTSLSNRSDIIAILHDTDYDGRAEMSDFSVHPIIYNHIVVQEIGIPLPRLQGGVGRRASVVQFRAPDSPFVARSGSEFPLYSDDRRVTFTNVGYRYECKAAGAVRFHVSNSQFRAMGCEKCEYRDFSLFYENVSLSTVSSKLEVAYSNQKSSENRDHNVRDFHVVPNAQNPFINMLLVVYGVGAPLLGFEIAIRSKVRFVQSAGLWVACSAPILVLILWEVLYAR